MAVHTVEQLEAALTTDLKWRTQEMFVFEQLVKKARRHELGALLRGGLALVHAHWEGYVKTAGSSYLEFVSRKKLDLGDLRPELVAVALRGEISRLSQENSSRSHTELVTMLLTENQPAKLPYARTTIRTRANLSFRVFDAIMHSLGCDAARFQTYELLIDERLLGSRNEIAHGREEYVDLVGWRDTRNAVEAILKDVRTQIANAALLETYRRK